MSEEHPVMICPACLRELQPITIGEVTVDVCHQGCGGIWFDHFELNRMDNAHEPAGNLLRSVEKDGSVEVDPTIRRKCPRCDNMKLRRHFFGIRKSVEVDSCPNCGGYWLDHGELFTIRDEFATDECRRKATQQFMEDLDDLHQKEACPKKLQASQQVRSLDAMFRIVGSRYT